MHIQLGRWRRLLLGFSGLRCIALARWKTERGADAVSHRLEGARDGLDRSDDRPRPVRLHRLDLRTLNGLVATGDDGVARLGRDVVEIVCARPGCSPSRSRLDGAPLRNAAAMRRPHSLSIPRRKVLHDFQVANHDLSFCLQKQKDAASNLISRRVFGRGVVACVAQAIERPRGAGSAGPSLVNAHLFALAVRASDDLPDGRQVTES